MLKLVGLLMALTATAISVSDSEWTVYKATYGKTYGEREDFLRRMIYQDNLRAIAQHNDKYARGESSFFMGENRFADMTHTEFTHAMNGLRIYKPVESVQTRANTSLPQTVDWVKRGYVTKVKDQGQCGSCWAFSTTGSVEGQHFKATGQLVSLSESNLVDCSGSYGNLGCKGGLMDNAFKYIIQNKGIDTEASYPYHPRDERCHFNSANVGATVKGFHDVRSGSERDLQEAVASVGPVSVAIDASHSSFQFYNGGVYDERRCSSSKLDHGVLVVGYGVDNGQDYWLVKNSWGRRWGMEGYIRMSRNKNNQCGIATQASYPLV